MNSLRRSALLFSLLLAMSLALPAAAQAGGAERLIELQRQQRQTEQLRHTRQGQTMRRRDTLQDRTLRRRGTLQDRTLHRRGTLQDRTLRRRGTVQDRPVSRLNRYGRYGNVVLQRQGTVQSGSRLNGSRALSIRSRGLSGARLGRGGARR